MRKNRCPVQSHRNAAFEISGENQRQLRLTLQLVRYGRGFERLVAIQERSFFAHREREAAQVILADGVAQFHEIWAGDVEELGMRPHHEQLPDLLLDAELLQRLLRPFFPVVVEMHRAMLDVLLARMQNRIHAKDYHQNNRPANDVTQFTPVDCAIIEHELTITLSMVVRRWSLSMLVRRGRRSITLSEEPVSRKLFARNLSARNLFEGGAGLQPCV